MTFTATVQSGKIILPPGVNWQDGTIVSLERVESQPSSLYDIIKDFDGIATDLPEDFAENHDHYLHGQARERE